MEATRTSSDRSFLRNLAQLSGSGMFGQIMQAITNYANAFVLGPSLLGVTKTASLIETYAGYNDFGVQFGLNRELAVARGEGNDQLALALKNTAFTLTLFFTGLALLALGLVYAFGWNLEGQINFQLGILICLLVVTSRIYGLYYFVMRAEGRFEVISKTTALSGLLSLLTGIPMLLLWKVPGVLSAIVVSRTMTIVMGFFWSRLNFALQIDFTAARQLFKVGLFSFLTNLENKLLRGLELIIISAMLTTTDLGLFGFALSVLAMTDVVSESARMIFFRKMAFSQGKFGSQAPRQLFNYYKSPFVLYLMTSVILNGIGFMVYAFLVPIILPKYTASIPLFFVLAIGEAFFKVRIFSTITLTALKRLQLLFVIQSLAIAFNAVLDIAFVKQGYGIMGAAIGSTISYVVFALIFLLVMYPILERTRTEGALFYLKMSCAVLLSWSAIWAVHGVVSDVGLSINTTDFIGQLFRLILQFIAFALLSILAFSVIFKKLEIWREIAAYCSKAIQALFHRMQVNKTL